MLFENTYHASFLPQSLQLIIGFVHWQNPAWPLLAVGFFPGIFGGTSTIVQAVPAAPTGLALVYNRDGSAATYYPGDPKLTWNTAAGVTWKLKRSTTSGSGYAELATGITTNNRTDPTAAKGTPYYYVVTANDASGQSVNSNQIAVTSRLERLNLATPTCLWTGLTADTHYFTVLSTSSSTPATVSPRRQALLTLSQ